MSAKLKSKAKTAVVVKEPQNSTRAVNLPPFSIPMLILLIGLISSCVIHFSHLSSWNDVKGSYYYDNDLPLLLTADGYYYLRLSSDLTDGQYNEVDELRPGQTRPTPIPLLARLTSVTHQITQIPLEKIAFYIPPILALLMFSVYLLWGYAISGAVVAFYSLLAGISSPCWYGSTCLGKFDTDVLNPVFVYLILYTMYRFVTIQARSRYIYLFASILISLIFGLWWDNVRYLGIFLVISVYCLSIFLPSSKIERVIKSILIVILCLIGIAVLFDLHSFFPAPLDRPIRIASFYLNLTLKATGSEFPDVGENIKELRAYSPKEFIFFTGGSMRYRSLLPGGAGGAVLA